MTTVPLHISGLSYGPHGVGRLDGKALFVRGVVPGEDVEVTVREDHGSYAYADLQRIVRPAADRRLPPCPYLPRCGGCPWQHVSYAAQLRAKEHNLREQLRRIGGLAAPPLLPIIPSPHELRYRSRLSLRTDNGRVGFYAGASHELVEVEHCLLAPPPVDAAIRAVAALLPRLRSSVRRMEIVRQGDQAAGCGERVVLVGEVAGRLLAADGALIPGWLGETPAVAGLVLNGKGWRRTWGDERITLTPEDAVRLTVRAGAFTQVNPLGNRLLVEQVIALGECAPHERVVDLYAGVGNLSLPIARRVSQVVAVEHQRLAAEDARANAAALGLSNCEVMAASARQALRELERRQARFDTVVIDPPRSGAAEIIAALLTLAPARLIYVSCNPSTLARDVKRLSARYHVAAVQPIDLFPHSYHTEVVLKAVLTC